MQESQNTKDIWYCFVFSKANEKFIIIKVSNYFKYSFDTHLTELTGERPQEI